MLKLGEVEQLVGRWDEAGAIFERALGQAQDFGDVAIQPWCHMAAGECSANKAPMPKPPLASKKRAPHLRCSETRRDWPRVSTRVELWRRSRAIMTWRSNSTRRACASGAASTIGTAWPACSTIWPSLQSTTASMTWPGRSTKKAWPSVVRGQPGHLANSLNNLGVVLLEQDDDRAASRRSSRRPSRSCARLAIAGGSPTR